MCGIVLSYLKNDVINVRKIENALNIIQHRGPDETSIWMTEDKHLALGHVRLSIMDVNNGSQPYFSNDKSMAAVINGEFYEYEKIRADLINKGYTFKTNCDSEILLPLYQEYGVNCLDYLRGEFAFVIWDKNKNIIFSARDRFGIKPLYYSLKNENLYVASEIKSILALGIPAEWDYDTVHLSNYGIYQQERTCFKNVYSIKPGHTLVFNLNRGNITHTKYWDLRFPGAK